MLEELPELESTEEDELEEAVKELLEMEGNAEIGDLQP